MGYCQVMSWRTSSWEPYWKKLALYLVLFFHSAVLNKFAHYSIFAGYFCKDLYKFDCFKLLKVIELASIWKCRKIVNLMPIDVFYCSTHPSRVRIFNPLTIVTKTAKFFGYDSHCCTKNLWKLNISMNICWLSGDISISPGFFYQCRKPFLVLQI